ncbi:MAG: cation:dicarboxylase symporter family transporter, partial [Spirochaetales bacterium]|nr:cation:dicarboxylase symporter family transporter [Candidatus Physcosoma equi]
MAALLLADATAFTFSSSAFLLEMTEVLSKALIEVGTFMFLPLMVVTFAAGTASLKKDKLGGKILKNTLLWAIISTAILSLSAVFFFHFFPQVFPTSSSAGGVFEEMQGTFLSKNAPIGIMERVIKIFLPSLFGAWILGAALTPSSDIIRPAYTVINSFSEAMYRIERTVAFFGGLFVYIGGIAFFLNLWQEKTILVAPRFFAALFFSAVALILVVLPLLYAFFTGFKRNPYGIIGRSLASMILGLVTSNLYATSLVDESISRCNLGAQKRIVSTTVPMSILIARGGTAFVATSVTLTLLST